MNSAELHEDLFTGFCFDFRRNIIRALIETRMSQTEMIINGHIDSKSFNRWINTKEEPEPEEIETLIEWLKKKGYEWK